MEIQNNKLGYLNMDSYTSQARANLAGTHDPQKNFDEIMRAATAARESSSSADRSGAVIKPLETPIDKNDELYKLCLELETFIVKNLITGMRNTVQKSGLVDDSYAGKIYEDMLYDEYAKDFTKNAGFGLAEQAYRQLKSYA